MAVFNHAGVMLQGSKIPICKWSSVFVGPACAVIPGMLSAGL